MNFLRQKIYRYNINLFNFRGIKKIELKKKIDLYLKRNFFLKNLIFVNMARIGLYLIIKVIIKKNKNVIIMSPFTIFDIINKILSAGATPKFVDSYSNEPHMSLKEIKKAYNENVIAILVTHFHSCHPEIDKIRAFCNLKKIYLIEDCAISLGSTFKNKNIGTFGDFSIFSFGVYKFISTPLGGLISIKSKSNYVKIQKKIINKNINIFLLIYFFMKGLFLKLLLNNPIFKFLVKKIIKYGTFLNLKFIDKILNNDPKPKKNVKPPLFLNTLPSRFQLYGIYRQLKFIKKDKLARIKNARIYSTSIFNKKITKPKLNFNCDSILNYPIILKGKNKLYEKLILNNFDVSNYYYRNCSNINSFKKYKGNRSLKNIEFYSKNVLCLPAYPGLNEKYIKILSKKINEF